MESDEIDYEVLFESLEDPCHTIFYFAFEKRKFVNWRSGEDKFKTDPIIYDKSVISNLEYLELLKNLHNHQFNNVISTKQLNDDISDAL